MSEWLCPDCGGGTGSHHQNCRQHQRTLGLTPGQAVIEERAKIRGDFREQARVSQNLKRMLHDARGQQLSDEQRECLEHMLEKMARIVTGDPDEVDAWRDLIGYPTLIHNILTKGKPI